MKLPHYLDCAKLEEHLRNGIVEQRFHNTLPLVIYCYSRKCTFDGPWDDVTTKCRGLIVEATPSMNIVARPFEKFFNIDTDSRPETSVDSLLQMPTSPVFSEKLDGSMGTLWHYRGHAGIATKGSFHSEQAEWATKWLLDKPGVKSWPVGYTPVFEIIAQSVQHHVVHYLPEDDNQLILTALINMETGAEMEPDTLHLWATLNGLKCADSYSDLSVYEAITSDRPDKEGLVATWFRPSMPPLKVKIKHPTFLKLQKIAHHTTPKTIFKALQDDGNPSLINDALQFGSDYLRDAVKQWMVIFDQEFQRISIKARKAVEASLVSNTTRKEHAAYFLGMHPDVAAVCFAILDEKDYRRTIWDLVEPLVKTIKYDEVEEA